MISLQESLSMVRFTVGEERAIAQAESTIDAELLKFDGAPVEVHFAVSVPTKVLAAVQRKYEERGGWKVVVESPQWLRLSPVWGAPARKMAAQALSQVLVPVPVGRRLLVRMPTRGRPEQALAVLAKYRSMAGIPVAIEVVVDEDDETMAAPVVLQRLRGLGCVITTGPHKSKVQAVNGGRVSEWDVLLLASDDMVPVSEHYATRALNEMERHFPHLDGAIFFDDGYQHGNCCTLPIIGRRLYDQFGYVYEPEYRSLFSDQEQTDVLQAMGRLAYVDEKIIEHRHWICGGEKDALYERNDALWEVDKTVYERRKLKRRPHAQWGFDAPPLWLSICICTIPTRRAQLEHLLDDLWWQIRDFGEVEVLVDDRLGPTVGEKRQALIERARGHFVCFVDDDDGVCHDYVHRVVGALRENPDADCASLVGVITTGGERPERFEHSLRYNEWFTKDGVHRRCPNHLNAVRRELALKVGFVSKFVGEDHDFSMRLRPLLQTEAQTGDAPLYYYFFDPARSVQSVAK